eukprot:4955610-Pleurochrysis_carterae.AAC.1
MRGKTFYTAVDSRHCIADEGQVETMARPRQHEGDWTMRAFATKVRRARRETVSRGSVRCARPGLGED